MQELVLSKNELMQRPAPPWPRDMFGAARLHLQLPFPKHDLQQRLCSPLLCACPGKGMEGCGRQGGASLWRCCFCKWLPKA